MKFIACIEPRASFIMFGIFDTQAAAVTFCDKYRAKFNAAPVDWCVLPCHGPGDPDWPNLDDVDLSKSATPKPTGFGEGGFGEARRDEIKTAFQAAMAAFVSQHEHGLDVPDEMLARWGWQPG